MLRVAVPNKGALAESAAAMLAEAGYRRRPDSKDLTVLDAANDVEFFFLRPKDIAMYVGSGDLDLGLTGRDLVLDSRAAVVERLSLGFGGSTFRYAGPADARMTVADLAGKRIATSFANIVRADLDARGIAAEIIRLDGAVEISVQLGLADAVADVVQSGRTLSQHGLAIFGEPMCESEAVLIHGADVTPSRAMEQLVARVQGVVIGQQYVMMDYDCPRTLLEAASAITPGVESPTVAPMADENWVAVRAMVPRAGHQTVMDHLSELGAKAILASDIRSCRF